MDSWKATYAARLPALLLEARAINGSDLETREFRAAAARRLTRQLLANATKPCPKDDELFVRSTREYLFDLADSVRWLDESDWQPVGTVSSKKSGELGLMQVGALLFVRHPEGTFRSADRGRTWTRVHEGTGDNGLWAIGNVGKIFVAVDLNGLVSLAPPDGAFKPSGKVDLPTGFPSFAGDGTSVYLAHGSKLFRSTDGKKWSAIKVPGLKGGRRITSIVAKGSHVLLTIFAADVEGSVVMSSDGGKKWNTVRTVPKLTECELSASTSFTDFVHACSDLLKNGELDQRFWIASSEDGVKWVAESSTFPADLSPLSKTSFLWIPRGRVEGDATSTGGNTWIHVPRRPAGTLSGLAIIPPDGMVALKDDGTVWGYGPPFQSADPAAVVDPVTPPEPEGAKR